MWYTQVRVDGTTLSPDREHVLSFDLEGRLISYFKQGMLYKRDLASQIHWRRSTEHGREHGYLTSTEAEKLFLEIQNWLQQVPVEFDPQRLVEIQNWTPARLQEEQQKFLAVYRPISILPPDQYWALVLQITEGCSWNRCTFCNFYQDRPFTVKTTTEVHQHIQKVNQFFGRSIIARKSIFLADGNALVLKSTKLYPILQEIKKHYPDHKIYSFIDVYTGEKHPVEHWIYLREMGLERVYIGMETGYDKLLELLNKPGSRAELREFVSVLKAADIAVSLIIMIGVGGKEYQQMHCKDTLDILLNLGLDKKRDLVYLSPFVEHEDSKYAQLRMEWGLTAMNKQEVESEMKHWTHLLRQHHIKVALYDIREFLY